MVYEACTLSNVNFTCPMSCMSMYCKCMTTVCVCTQRFDVKWLQPKYQNREYVEDDGELTDKQRAVILGVHDRSYKNGELAKDPSVNDFKVLNEAYKRKHLNI